MNEFKPENLLESALLLVSQSKLKMDLFLGILAGSEVVLPSAREVQRDGSGFQPLFFQKGHLGMMVACSSLGRIGGLSSKAPYAFVLKGIDLIRRLPPEYGFVVNPGHQVGFDMTPEGVSRLKGDLGGITF